LGLPSALAPLSADDVIDERVVEDLEVLERVDEPTDVVVGVLHEPGVDLHLPREKGLHVVGHVVPRGDLFVARGQLGVGRNDAERLLPRERLLAHRVPALVELALVLVGPLGRDVVRSVPCRPARSTMKNGLSGMSDFCWRTHEMALSVMSSVKW